MREPKQKLEVYLEPELIKVLEKESYRVGISTSHLIEKAIEDRYIKLYNARMEELNQNDKLKRNINRI